MRQAKAFITCVGGSTKVPEVNKETQVAAEQDAAVTESRDKEALRRRAAASNTVLTSYMGTTTPATTQTKTLLGQ